MPSDEARADELCRHPRDTLILPLLAPMAPLLLRLGGLGWAEGEEHSFAADHSLLETEPDLEAPAAKTAVMRVGAIVSLRLGELAHTLADGWLSRGIHPRSAESELAAEWLAKAAPPLPVAAVVLSALRLGPANALMPYLSLPPHAVARMLATYAGRFGVADWTSAWRIAQSYWADPANCERLFFDAWMAAWGEIEAQQEYLDEVEAELAELQRPPGEPSADDARGEGTGPDGDTPRLRLVTDAGPAEPVPPPRRRPGRRRPPQ